MSSCERCWRESRWNENYAEVLKRNEGVCSPEDQAGPDATVCGVCGRKARHQWTNECMSCGDWPESMRPKPLAKGIEAADRDTAAKMIEAMIWQYENKANVCEYEGKHSVYWEQDGKYFCTEPHDTPWDALLDAKKASE